MLESSKHLLITGGSIPTWIFPLEVAYFIECYDNDVVLKRDHIVQKLHLQVDKIEIQRVYVLLRITQLKIITELVWKLSPNPVQRLLIFIKFLLIELKAEGFLVSICYKPL